MKSFEERLERLESIADQLRDGTVPIDTASKLFEEGIKLSQALEGELRRLERRIEILVTDPGEGDPGNDDPGKGDPPVLELFPELDR